MNVPNHLTWYVATRLFIGTVWIGGAVFNAFWTLPHASIFREDLGTHATFGIYRWFFGNVVGATPAFWTIMLVIGEAVLGALLFGKGMPARAGLIGSGLWSLFLAFIIWPHTLMMLLFAALSFWLLRYEHEAGMLDLVNRHRSSRDSSGEGASSVNSHVSPDPEEGTNAGRGGRFRDASRQLLIGVAAFSALSAIGGGIGLMTSGIGMPSSVLDDTPFDTFTIPALVLVIVVGGGMCVASIAAWRKRSYAGLLGMIAGAIMLGWIVVEAIMIHDGRALQAMVTILSLITIGTGWMLFRKERLTAGT